MGKARRGTTARRQTKAAGRRKQVKENAAALNEPINSRERMIKSSQLIAQRHRTVNQKENFFFR